MSKRKKLRGGRLGVLSEREFFETFGPKPKPPRELTWGETFFGYQPGTQPGTPPPQAQASQPVAPGHPAFVRRHPPTVDARHFFDIPGMWAYVFQNQGLPRFRVDRPGGVTVMLPIDQLTDAPDQRDPEFGKTWQVRLASFFGIPDQEIRSRNPEDSWNQYLGPFIEQIEKQINLERPPGMDGGIYIRPDENGGFWTVFYK
jgi:hypothetical protein